MPKICDQFMCIDCDDANYPLKDIFNGIPRKEIIDKEDSRKRRYYQSLLFDSLDMEEKQILSTVEELNDLDDLWIKKADYLTPDDILKAQTNPYVEFVFIEGCLEG